MVIDINQQKLSVRDKYRIFLNQQEAYYATSAVVSWLAKLEVYKVGNDLPSVVMQQQWAWFNTEYHLAFDGGSEARFTTASVWKRHFQCYVGGSAYDIYGQKGRKVSVYKDGRQIAWWDKQSVSWFNGDNHQIIADDGTDYEALIAFCLILDKAQSNDKSSGITINLGHFGPEAKAFDPTWQPKQNWKGT
ncbi:hypothetical protein [Rufibacter sp. LB8]|uniref:hypothetical protein n=1 Tax=Rufibacter sp. LB8 TaxID=2777781 RepID=UPI00178C2977|nr:hypothetical protein [Rufibacter sp. LB8]